MAKETKMVLHGNTRYTERDAKRLGLIADGKVITNRSVEVQRTTNAPGVVSAAGEGLITSAAEHPEQPGESKPGKGAKKAEWVEYAKAHGVEDPESLTKEQLVELFAE